jgi:hypothetical protein
MANRIHEDDIWEREEWKAAQAKGRQIAAAALETARQDYFGYLTMEESNAIKAVIRRIERRSV